MRLFYLALFCTFMVVPSFAVAQTPTEIPARDYCLKSEQSAQTRTCLNEVYEKSSAALNDVFNIAIGLAGDSGDLAIVQQSWVSYRDAACAHAVAKVENESLKPIEKLSCLIDLTEKRSAYLMRHNDMVGASVHERLQHLPRWMNVLSTDYPDYFWRYGAALTGDLNCDGMMDDLVMGVNPSVENGQFMIAIAQSGEMGRPQVSLVPTLMPHAKQCTAVDPFTFDAGVAVPATKPEGESLGAKQCSAALYACDGLKIQWRDGRFVASQTKNPMAQ